jgi:large subunit ribosomal protein LP0
MAKQKREERKAQLFSSIGDVFRRHTKFLVLGMDNVTAAQLQDCKRAWKGRGEFLFRKNTVMKKALERMLGDDARSEAVREAIQGNVAFFFTNEEIKPIKDIIDSKKRQAFAKTGAVAQRDLWIEPMITTMDSEKAPYFQALGITYKITKSKLEIISRIKVLEEGKKVGPAQANLLSILNVQPFVYMMKILNVNEDGEFYEPWIVDVTRDDVVASCHGVVDAIAALSLATGTVTKASLRYSLVNAVRDAIALSLATGCKIKEAAPFLK